jgi:two-component system LytT family response regulator
MQLPLTKNKIIAMQRITLNTIDAIHLVKIQDILYCKSNNSYTTFYLTNHKPIIVSRSIKEIEEQLRKSSFIRSHQSYLVNPKHVVEVSKANNYAIVLSDNSRIPTSTRKRKEILQILLEK